METEGKTPLEELAEIIAENEADNPMFYADPDYQPLPAAEYHGQPVVPSYTSIPLGNYSYNAITHSMTGYYGTLHSPTGTSIVNIGTSPYGYFTAPTTQVDGEYYEVKTPDLGQQEDTV